MKKIEAKGDIHVHAGEDFELQVRAYRSGYDNLLSLLGTEGTEVTRQRTLEVDLDIAPHDFIRDALHDFIFPPQPDAELASTVESGILAGTEPYTLTVDKQRAVFDAEKVAGRLILRYDDAEAAPILLVDDMRGNSVIPDSVVAGIDEIMQKLAVTTVSEVA